MPQVATCVILHKVEELASHAMKQRVKASNNINPATTLPFSQSAEMMVSTRWLIGMRWLAGVGVLFATWIACCVLDLGLAAPPLYVTGLVILVYNGGLHLQLNRLNQDTVVRGPAYRWLAAIQVGLDWLAMTALIHFSGGIESPIIFFFPFHIIIAALLFSQRIAYFYAFTALVLVGGLVALELTGWLPHIHVEGYLLADSHRNPAFYVGIMASFATTSLVTVYLASSIADRLRRREEQLGSLYLGAQTINSTLELPEVLDRLVQATVAAMGVSGASIGLVDSTGTKIEVAASHGLSKEYLGKGPILLQEGYIHTDVVRTGRPAIIQSDKDRAGLQYPAEMVVEGIRSALYVRLQARNRTLGVVRAYSRQPNLFTSDDARFLSAIAAQGAVAIENAMSYLALKQMDMDKSQFVRAVTHELRSPVTGAQSLLRGVIKGYAGELNDRQRDIMNRLNRRLDRLEALINDLLDLAAGRSGMKVEKPQDISLVEALQQVLSIVEAQVNEKEQKLAFEPPPGNPMVHATEEGLNRVFLNLVGNAVKYTPERGAVTISVEQRDHEVMVRIADTGIGIPVDSLPRLFTEFYRAPNAKAFETGTGLGLVIVKELVASFDGRISVESTEGKGTIFTVHLPTVAA